jgi:hypothetical protein
LGPSAVAGSSAGTAAMAGHEAAVVSATAALKSAKAAVDNLTESEDRETASLAANISERQAATGTSNIAEGRMMGSESGCGCVFGYHAWNRAGPASRVSRYRGYRFR